MVWIGLTEKGKLLSLSMQLGTRSPRWWDALYYDIFEYLGGVDTELSGLVIDYIVGESDYEEADVKSYIGKLVERGYIRVEVI